MINLVSKIGRDRYQKEMEREMTALELSFSKNVRHLLGRQYLDAARLMEINIYNVECVEVQATRLRELLATHYKRVATVFYGKAMQSLSTLKSDLPIEGKDTTMTMFWAAVSTWIQERTAEKVTQINATTKSLLKKVIEDGMKKGKSFRDIAKEIRKVSNITNVFRSMTIAMTETHSMTVYSIDTAMKATGMVTSREWMNAGDERVRSDPFDHVAANGEVVGTDEKFVRTGEPLAYPGDPDGSVGNIIRCRCVLLYNMTKPIPLHQRNLLRERTDNINRRFV